MSRARNTKAALASGLGVAGTLVGGPWGWLIAAASSITGLVLGGEKLFEWGRSFFGVRNHEEVNRRELAQLLAKHIVSPNPSQHGIDLAKVFGVNDDIRRAALFKEGVRARDGEKELIPIIYAEMSRW